MSMWLLLLNGLAVSVFGSILSASFCGALSTPRNRRIFACVMVVLPLLQGGVIYVWGVEVLRRIYPLVVHLPLLLYLFVLTRKLLQPIFSVLSAYLCCQVRRWFALVFVAIFNGGSGMQDMMELVLTLPLLLFLLRFVASPIRQLTLRPVRTQLQFGLIPLLYYMFDYVTVVYTDLLISGSPVALEFMPFVCCLAYLIFLLYNSATERERIRLEHLQKSLDLQLEQSAREIHALRESQTLASQYRHDLRHHLQYVSTCIENGQNEQAQTYISGIFREIESQKVQRYCENDAANLILSAFSARAKKNGIVVSVQGTLPSFIKVSDSDLCVVLSNALENAIHACRPLVAEGTDCTIDVQFYERAEKIFLQVTNPCGDDVCFENGLPVSDRPDHGIGVQSICAIVQRYGGVYTFLTRGGQFILRLSF